MSTQPRARRIITIAAGKGGVGKSIIAANLAVAFAEVGQRVLLVDADLGSPNLHTLIGIDVVRVGLDGFFARGGPIESAAVPTLVKGLSLVPGAFQGDAANLAAPLRRHLVEAIRGADADVVVVDVGAGTGVATVELFLAADQRVLVMVPQLPSVQNAYLFLKAAMFQLLCQVADAAGESSAPADVLPRELGKLVTALATLRAKRPELAARITASLAGHGVTIIGNQVVDRSGVATIEAMTRMIRDYLAITPTLIGTLHASPAARACVEERRPFVLDPGAARPTAELRRVATNLLSVDVAARRARDGRSGRRRHPSLSIVSCKRAHPRFGTRVDGNRRYDRAMRRASPIAAAAAALALAALSGCVSDGAATDAGVDAHVIVVTDPIDARPPTRDAPIRDAGALPDATQYDAFPCLVRPLDQNVATLAGCAAPGATDGARSVARFNNPVNVVLGPDGDLYVADHDNHRIRAIKTADGTTRTVIDHAGFRRPWGMAFASDGRFYVQTDEDDAGRFDDDSGTLWVVDRSARRATVVLRGVGRPRGMAALGDGRIALADPAHHTVRLFVKVQPMDQPPTYAVQPLAGAEDKAGFVNQTGGAARFNEPSGVAVLPDGSLVVADQGNHRIRRVALDGVVTTFAGKGGIGSEDGAVADARFSAPRAVAADMNGDVWVADGDNHLIRKISGGMVSTVAGNGTAGYEDSNDRTAAAFFGMEGLDVAANGKTVWLADGTRGDDLPYHRVRRIRFP